MRFDEDYRSYEISTIGGAFEVNLVISTVSRDLQGPSMGVGKLESEPGQVRALSCACK